MRIPVAELDFGFLRISPALYRGDDDAAFVAVPETPAWDPVPEEDWEPEHPDRKTASTRSRTSEVAMR